MQRRSDFSRVKSPLLANLPLSVISPTLKDHMQRGRIMYSWELGEGGREVAGALGEVLLTLPKPSSWEETSTGLILGESYAGSRSLIGLKGGVLHFWNFCEELLFVPAGLQLFLM